jgi:hypothetical protein
VENLQRDPGGWGNTAAHAHGSTWPSTVRPGRYPAVPGGCPRFPRPYYYGLERNEKKDEADREVEK